AGVTMNNRDCRIHSQALSGQTGLLQDRVCQHRIAYAGRDREAPLRDRAEPDFVPSLSLAPEPAAGLAQERRQAAIPATSARTAFMSSSKASAWQHRPGMSSPSVD